MIYDRGYNSKIKGYPTFEKGKETKCYKSWLNMLKRCYSSSYHLREPSYSECEVCPEWLDFQNFAEWYTSNFYSILGEIVCLDKDLLISGNKIYSPSTCLFLPEYANKMLTNTCHSKGKYPTGVSLHIRAGKFTSSLSTPDGKMFLGYFDTPESASEFYNLKKEDYVRSIAEKYKKFIPYKVYTALLNYKVS